MNNKTLYLPLKAKWYDMIESGEKEEEYREIKPYWIDTSGTPIKRSFIRLEKRSKLAE